MDILEEAKQIVEGDRREAYGPVEESFKRHAMVWSAILQPKLKSPITPEEVTLMMVGLKLMREANSSKHDNRVDIIGYILLRDILCTTALQKTGQTEIAATP